MLSVQSFVKLTVIYVGNEVAPVCSTECVEAINGEVTSSVEIDKGIGGPRAAVARVAAMVATDIKKGATRR